MNGGAKMWRNRILGGVVLAALALPVFAADLPKSTTKMLQEMKMDPEILSGIDKELNVPPEWIEAAKKEGVVKISATWDPGQFTKMVAPFLERYPFIRHEYSRGSRQERTMKPLVAFQSGRIVVDLVGSLGASFALYKQAGALEDMRDLPTFNTVPVGMRDEDGLWIGQRMRYWCMSYNTNLVKKADLPKTWDDLLTNPIWRNGHLALSDRPNLWVGNLWVADGHGEEWGKNFITHLFQDLKPQLRKEGNNALVSLVIAGEFYAAIPSADYRTKQYVDKGAPISWHCPEPVPMSISEMSMIKGNPHPYASKLWVNWFLSKEGQLAQYYADQATPVHKELHRKEFIPFPDEIEGRKIAFRDPVVLEETLPRVFEAWNPLWERAKANK
ncbi:MAG TPA: extracellular solute-binding protein [Alphaproteobacteria bacterium]|jgi:iron(III) transport system substrate-binding protein|nr:extracellular solute-binding protein [Alphaproteobacteria bacterium]